ncbi:hypothetical protein [Micromonospora sp. NBC_01813]|uniref:hypothetical protein n=1 Tax=Micromonospora sp. NBC_01813 TaxID=2975988 RepID=UPI002DDC63A3|nr:hypothetical protein [Micromonospora sp. NBC_01813]WSA06300.1 hypothetical protein OG958_18425 [Micromonospora sp. NBC_01813]
MRVRDMANVATSEPSARYIVHKVATSGRQVQRRRQRGWQPIAVTAVAVLGLVAAAALPSLLGRALLPFINGPLAQEDAAVPGPPFTFTFAGYQVGKLQVADPIIVSTAYQIASVYADGMTTNDGPVSVEELESLQDSSEQDPTWYAYLTVYRPGAYDPTSLVGAGSVTVADRPGLEINSSGGAWAATRTLAWEYAGNAWAVINASSSEADYPSAEELRELAAGWRPAPPTPAKVPFTMAYVPAGYSLDEVAMHAMTGLNGIANARTGDHAGLLFSSPAQPTTGLTAPFGGVDGYAPPGSFRVYVGPAANSNQQASPGVTCDEEVCNRWVAGDSVNVQVSSGGRLSDAEMTKILDGISIGDVSDEGSWAEVGTAIP